MDTSKNLNISLFCRRNNLVKLVLFCLVLLSVFAYKKADAAEFTISGAMWSSTIGWINASSTVAPAYSLKLNGDATGGTITGQAWSSNIGWVSFDAVDTDEGACPSSGVTYDSTGYISGFARAIAGNTAQSGGWDGCIGFSVGGTGANRPRYTAGVFSGYAWGDMNVGWLSLSGLTTSAPATFSCLNTPSNATVCPDDDTGLSANFSGIVVDSCSAPQGSVPKCQYTCNSGYENVDGVCVVSSCPGGANNPPICNACTPPLVWNGTSCVGGTVSCHPKVNNTFVTFAKVGELVTWVATGTTANSTWSSTLGGPTQYTGIEYPIRYSTIGNKTMFVEGVQCTLQATGGNKLPIINNPDIHEN